MPTTIIGQSPGVSLTASPAIVYIRQRWGPVDSGDEYVWRVEPALEFHGGSVAVGNELGTAQLVYNYGAVKAAFETTVAERLPRDLNDWWVDVRLIDADTGGEVSSWVGRIKTEKRSVARSSAELATGSQNLVAYSPLHLLARISVAESLWWQDEEEQRLQWVPHFNARDAGMRVVGNRSATLVYDGSAVEAGVDPAEEVAKASYRFGGTDLWTRLQIANYLLKCFADESDLAEPGPDWSLGGQTELLDVAADTIEQGSAQTIASMLDRLIPTALGLTYKIIATDSGFEVNVRAISAEQWSFGSVSLPLNSDLVLLKAAEAADAQAIEVERSSDHEYGTINILGSRMVTCCSLRVDDGSLTPKWESALKEAYDEGTGENTDKPELHDKTRLADLYRPVYQRFGAPADWDFQGQLAAPRVNLDGTLTAMSDGNYQTQVRRTLAELPLREGVGYGGGATIDRNPAGHEPDFQPLMVWVYDEKAQRYVLADAVGMTVYASTLDWGVLLSASPNHLLALNHFGGEPEEGSLTLRESDSSGIVTIEGHSYLDGQEVTLTWEDATQRRKNMKVSATTGDTFTITGGIGTALPEQDTAVMVGLCAAPTEQQPVYDYSKLIATVAMHTDKRLVLGHTIPDARPSDGVLNVPFSEAELWYLAPHTVVGVSAAGALVTSGAGGRVLRNDTERMAAVMVGALARYSAQRYRAEVTFEGLLPWSDLLGQILIVEEVGGQLTEAKGLISRVTYSGPINTRTTIHAGFV